MQDDTNSLARVAGSSRTSNARPRTSRGGAVPDRDARGARRQPARRPGDCMRWGPGLTGNPDLCVTLERAGTTEVDEVSARRSALRVRWRCCARPRAQRRRLCGLARRRRQAAVRHLGNFFIHVDVAHAYEASTSLARLAVQSSWNARPKSDGTLSLRVRTSERRAGSSGGVPRSGDAGLRTTTEPIRSQLGHLWSRLSVFVPSSTK